MTGSALLMDSRECARGSGLCISPDWCRRHTRCWVAGWREHSARDDDFVPDPHGFDLPDAPVVAHRRSIIDEARLGYEAHWEQMLLAYPHLKMTPWDDQDAAVREAWVEAVTPEAPLQRPKERLLVDDPEVVEEASMVVAAQRFVRDHGGEPDAEDGRLLAYYVEALVSRLRRLRAERDA